MSSPMIFEEFKEKLSKKKKKNVICFKTFENVSLLSMFVVFKKTLI